MLVGQNKFRQDFHYFLLCLVILTIPFNILLNSYLIILFGINWLFDKTFILKLKRIKEQPFFFLFSLLYIIQLIGMLYTEDMVNGNLKLESKLSLLIMPLIFSTSELSNRRTMNVLILFISNCTFISLLSMGIVFYNFSLGIPSYFPSMDDFTAVLKVGHPYMGMYIVFSSFSILFLFLKLQGRFNWKQKTIMLFAFFTQYSFLILIGARTATIASIFLIIAFIIYYIIFKKRIILSLVLLCLFSSSFLYILSISTQLRNRLLPIFSTDLPNNPLYVKSETWQCGWQTFTHDHKTLIAGVGTGDVKKHLLSCYEKMGFEDDRERQFNVHNEYIDEAARHGIIGLIIYLSCLFIPLAISLKRKKYLYSIFLIIIIICSVSESILSVQKGTVFYSLFNSLLMFNYLLKKEKSEGSIPLY